MEILIVEDDPNNVEYIKSKFGIRADSLGHANFTVTDSGRAAIRIINENSNKFDLLITDNQLNEEDGRSWWGIEIIRRLRYGRPHTPYMKIILMSSEYPKWYDDGAPDKFVLKPNGLVDIDELVSAIRNLQLI